LAKILAKAVKIKTFKDLDIWKRSVELVEDIYRITKSLPKHEIYGLTAQMRRAAVSILSNISEGFARFHNKEYRQLLFISLGSCAELTTQIIIALRLGYIDDTSAAPILNELDELSKMTMSLIKKLN